MALTGFRASRPYMPGYGTLGQQEGGGLLPWSFAEQRLRESHDYWLSSARVDGRPHLMPVWGVWLDEAVWFSSSNGSRKARNVSENALVAIATDNAHAPVVIEGRAERVDDASDALASFNAAVNAKYATSYELSFYSQSGVWRVLADVVFALDDANFIGSPTRWVRES